MTSLTFYGGVNEIGGNKILLEDKDTKVFLDFGKGFGRRSKFFESFLNPRTTNGIGDFIQMGLVPDIKGAYRTDLLKIIGREPEECDIDACLLTHAHSDHADYISFLHENIPIYMGDTCKLILQAIQEKGTRKIENEVLDFKERPSSAKDEPIERDVKTFRTGDKFTVGSIEVEPIHVDHSVAGAYGFLLHTSSGTIGYTGDMRFHGINGKMTQDFVDRAKEEKPIAMICEGTRFGKSDKLESEENVRTECNKIVSDTDRIVFADFNFKDVDRMRTFFNVAKENNRKFVVKLKDAYFLKHLSQDPKLNVPNVDDDDIIIYLPKMRSGKYVDSDYTSNDQQFIDQHNAWTAEQIAARENKVVCSLGFYNFTSLIDMNPKAGAVYIHSASEPYNEEQEISQERTDNWIEHFGMKKFQSHCSGHARTSDLLAAMKDIGAKTLYPVHTEQPELYKSISSDVVIVQEAKRYEI